jgi:hypothetical protein
MRRLPATAAVVVAALVMVSTTHGDPLLRYSWDQCDPVVTNKDFSGPMVYRQTLSAVDLPVGFVGFQIVLSFTDLPPAWQFMEGGCAGPERLSASPLVPGCDAIPGLELQVFYAPIVTEPGPHVELVVIGSTKQPLTADPGRRYGLATLEFDHASSGTTCGGATEPVCAHVRYADSYQTHSIVTFVTVEDFVGWNDPPNTLGCPGATRGRAGTWGRVKAIYR